MKLHLFLCAIVCLVLSVGCSKRSTVNRLNDELVQKNAEISRLESELTTQQRMNEELRSKLSDLTEENHVLIQIWKQPALNTNIADAGFDYCTTQTICRIILLECIAVFYLSHKSNYVFTD